MANARTGIRRGLGRIDTRHPWVFLRLRPGALACLGLGVGLRVLPGGGSVLGCEGEQMDHSLILVTCFAHGGDGSSSGSNCPLCTHVMFFRISRRCSPPVKLRLRLVKRRRRVIEDVLRDRRTPQKRPFPVQGSGLSIS